MKTIVTSKKVQFHWSLALLCHPHHWFCFRLIEFVFIYLFMYVFIYLFMFVCKRIKCCTTIPQHTHTKNKSLTPAIYTRCSRGCAHSSVHGTSNSKLTDRYFFYYAVITHENRTTVFKVHMQTKYRCVDLNSQFKRSAFVF